MQQRLVLRVEGSERHERMLRALRPPLDGSDTDAITAAARSLARTCGARAMLCCTTSGNSVRRLARQRPGMPILALTPNIATARALTLHSSVYPAVLDPDVLNAPRKEAFYALLEQGIAIAERKGLLIEPTDRMVCTAGLPFKMLGTANAIRIVELAGMDCYGGQCMVPDDM